MAKTYTLSECVAMLNVDYKTFQRWLDRAGIDTNTQISRFDNRIRFLYEEQLKKLAQDHGRTLQPHTERPTEMIPPNAYKQLQQQVDDIERQGQRTLRYLEDYELRINKALDGQEVQLQAHDETFLKQAESTRTIEARLLALEQQSEQALKDLDQTKQEIADLQQRHADLENTLREAQESTTDLEQRLAEAQTQIRELLLAKTKRSASKSSQEPAQIVGLPKGSVTARSFAEAHDIDRFHMAKWADEGQFATTITKRGERNQHNLTPEQQNAVIVWWNEHNMAYTPCEHCPHEPLIKESYRM
jgi:DNA repair ATPase RecN